MCVAPRAQLPVARNSTPIMKGRPMWPSERAISSCRHWTVVALIGCALGGFGLNGAPGLATADPDPDDIAALVAAVADAEQQLHDVGAEIQERQEGDNKAIAA